MTKLVYNFFRLFWSIYFAICILVIGTIMGYLLTFIFFVIARSLRQINPKLSQILLDYTEYFYTGSIRFLLVIQPWLNCNTNFSNLYNFKKYFASNCKTKRLLFVANHRSNLDTFLMISWIPGIRGLAKSTLYYNFFFAPFMWITGFIPVEKGSGKSFIDGLEKIRTQLLEKNIPVLIFPENTRCAKGNTQINKWSQSIFKTAMDSKATIIPVVIKNTDSVLGKGDWLLTPFAPIEIKMLPPVEAIDWKDSSALSESIHQMLQSELN